MGGRVGEKKVAKRGTIGQQVFDEVEKLTAGGGMNRLAAFKQIAEASGRAVGTVAANYYRIARQNGAPLRARRPGRPAGTVTKELARINTALQLVAAALQAQEEELARLRSQSAAFMKIRQLLKA